MKVEGIVLHPDAAQSLDTYLQSPTHAVLLAGPLGIGKVRIATELAARLLETTAYALSNHAYFKQVMPKDGTIGIADIRELVGFFRLKVPGGKAIHRVALILDADTMGHEAQNALLKMLEEPPAGSVLILTSSTPRNILQTISSRTQRITLPAPTRQQLAEHFAAQGTDPQKINSALMRADTNVAEATRLLSDGEDGTDTIAVVRQVLGADAYGRMLLVDGLLQQKDKGSEFVRTLAQVAEASLLSAASKNPTSLDRWHSVLQASHIATTAYEQNGNAKLVLTELMLAL